MWSEIDSLLNVSYPRGRSVVPNPKESVPQPQQKFESKVDSREEDEQDIEEFKIQELPGQESKTKDRIRNEHQNYREMPLFCSLDELHARVGPNVRYYFMFGYTTLAVNVIMGMFASILTGFNLEALVNTNTPDSSVQSVVQNHSPFYWLSIQYLPSSLQSPWILFLVVNLFFHFVYPWIYQSWIRRVKARIDISSSVFDPNVQDDIHLGRTGKGGGSNAMDFIVHRYAIDTNRMKDRPRLGSRDLEPPVHRSQEMQLNRLNDRHLNDEVSITNYQQHQRNANIDTALEDFILDDAATLQLNQQQKVTERRRFMGRLASAAVFFGLLIINAAVNFAVYTYPDYHNQYLIAIALASALTIFNLIWTLVSHRVTKWEQHIFWTTYYRSYFIKTYCFRICSTLILFCVSRLSVFGRSLDNAANPDECPFESLSQLYLVTLLSETFSSLWNGIGLNWTLRTSCVQRILAIIYRRKHLYDDDEYMPEFVLVEEYVDLLHKQILVLLGISVFPIMALGMSGLLFLELFLDRLKLKWYCKPVAITNNSFRKLLIFLNIVNILLAFFFPPTGILWILINKTGNCSLVL